MSYAEFIESKSRKASPVGFEVKPSDINRNLFDWQRDIVRWALRRGRAALFEDCGLGKTLQQLEWAHHVAQHTGGRVIVHCPVGVRRQTESEARKFGVETPIAVCDSMGDVLPGPSIALVNYEKLHLFDTSQFTGVVLDESSILKSYTGQTRNALIAAWSHVKYRLCCTATPAPNDHMELGNHSEFLGVMPRSEMLATYFVHDGGDTSKWRLRGHAESVFWEWVSGWAIFMRSPEDIGYDGSDYVLPEMEIIDHVVESGVPGGRLFGVAAQTLQERRDARRDSIPQRVGIAAELANGSPDPWICWCNYNKEGELLRQSISDAVEVAGSDSISVKESRLHGFSNGDHRVMVTKPKIAGFGMNWQHCSNVVVFPTDSYEQWYQMIRRTLRYGQKNTVRVHVVTSEAESAILQNLERKSHDAQRMFDGMVEHMRDLSSVIVRGEGGNQDNYKATKEIQVPSWM